MSSSAWQRKKIRETERIRDFFCVDKCEIIRSKTFGIFSKIGIWKLFAGKHRGLRITVRDNSIHKGVRTCIVRAQGIRWYELRNSTWRGRRFWADHSRMPRIHAFSSKPTIQSLFSNCWRHNYWNNYWTSRWSSYRENSCPIWTWNCNSITELVDNGHLMLWFPQERVGSWMKFIFPMPNSDPVQNYSLNVRTQKEEKLAWDNRR